MGGYRVQGRSESAAEQLLRDARALEGAGAFAVVLEGIPRELAALITRELSIPTIGIGAGPECDGQVLVIHDLLGLGFGARPKFVRQYADLGAQIRSAADAWRHDVEESSFPADAESYHLPADLRHLPEQLARR
jgi:3-methyl-2-oxobutanoate hydroxymethyltransferase